MAVIDSHKAGLDSGVDSGFGVLEGVRRRARRAAHGDGRALCEAAPDDRDRRAPCRGAGVRVDGADRQRGDVAAVPAEIAAVENGNETGFVIRGVEEYGSECVGKDDEKKVFVHDGG